VQFVGPCCDAGLSHEYDEHSLFSFSTVNETGNELIRLRLRKSARNDRGLIVNVVTIGRHIMVGSGVSKLLCFDF
jgi:hypothetical protein